MNTVNLVITALVGALLGFMGSVAYLQPEVRKITRELGARAPIMIIDQAKLAADALPVRSSQETRDEHFRNVQSLVDHYVEAGFIVLSRQAIVQAPGAAFIQRADLPAHQSPVKEKE